MPERLASFRGRVECQRQDAVPGLTLTGTTSTPCAEHTALAFSAAAPADLPATLEDAEVEHLGGSEYRIAAAGRSWTLSAPAVHLHSEIAPQFYRAIPPRTAPWRKRVFWRVVLALAASRAGLALLRALRR
jgi:hypothetical protein